MEVLAWPAVSLAALLLSILTLYSGFGLGTLLMPVFAVFVPVPLAVAATAVVHLANNVLKVSLLGRGARRDVVLQFGLPAVAAAFAGAEVLAGMGRLEPLGSWSLAGKDFVVEPVALGVGVLMLAFAVLELRPRFAGMEFGPRLLPVGGLLSGFFGGFTGHQGAFRAAFLAKAGLTAEEFVGTTAVIGLAVDLVRVAVYGGERLHAVGGAVVPWGLVGAAAGGAFGGVLLGTWVLRRKKITMRTVQVLTGALLALFGAALAAGLL